MALSRIETVSYNGVTFGEKTSYAFDSTPIRDEAGRTVVAVEHVVTISTIVTGEEAIAPDAPAIGSTMELIRRLTASDGGILSIENTGFGDLIVNTNGVFDVDFGPKVLSQKFEPIAADRAATLVLVLSCKIPECTTAVYRNEIMALNYEAQWTISHGITRRTISGYIEIPMTRWGGQANRSVPDNADRYRERLSSLLVPEGFRRSSLSFQTDKSKRRLTFAITDEELDQDNAPFENAVEMSGDHIVSNSEPVSFVSWDSTISFSVRAARNATKHDIYVAIIGAIDDRVDQAIKGATAYGQAKSVIPLRMSIREDLYGRNFDVTFSYFFTTSRDTLLQSAGMWRPLKGAAWNAWATKMDPVWDLRGYAKLGLQTSDDVIVDLCEPLPPRIGSGVDERPPPDTPNRLIGYPQSPNQLSSWLGYRCDLRYHRTDSIVRHKPLYRQEATLSTNPGNPTPLTGWFDPKTAGQPRIGNNSSKDDIIQIRSSPSYSVEVTGEAARVAYDIPIPELSSVGGLGVEKLDVDVVRTVIGTTLAKDPIFAAAWTLSYLVKNSPVNMAAPPSLHQLDIPNQDPRLYTP